MGNRIVRSGPSLKALLVIVLSLAPTAAFANTLSWSIVTKTGSLDYAVAGGALTGTGIVIQSVQNIATGSVLNIFNGVLNFTTGPISNAPWSWGAAAANTLTLTGCINNVTVVGNCTSGSTVLFSDDFTNAQIFQFGPSYQVQLGNIVGTLNSALAQQFGVTTDVPSALYNTTVSINASFGSTFSNGVNLGGTLTADPPAAPVGVPAPEPSSLILLGSGLVAMVGAGAKHRKLFR